MNFLAQKRSNILLDNSNSQKTDSGVFDDFYYKEINKLSAVGGFSINFKKKISHLDPGARSILQTPEGFRLSLNTSLQFYAEKHQEKAAKLFSNCGRGKPFSTTLRMITYTEREFWAKVIGKPIYGKDQNIIGIRGVFQDINSEKIKELDLQKSLKVIASQNSRLNNFANIVTHSVRSHASNIQLTLELLATSECNADKDELISNLNDISNNLNTTVEHLSELVAIQSKSTEKKEEMQFETVLDKVKNRFSLALLDTNTEIYSDFSEVPSIDYIPSYLENILYNLISNSIKFRSRERTPIIEIFSYSENDRVHLMIKDNGLGIDLDKYGKKIFNIYQTFHAVKDSNGVGLFLTKNQIEALQGTISVKSQVDQGTTFTIKF